MRKYDESSYAYAVGRINAIENKMLDLSKIDMLINSQNASDAFRILQDAGYSDENVKSIDGYEKLLSKELLKTYEILHDLAPEREVIDIFLLKNDYHNLKVLVKQEFSKNKEFNYENILIPNGTIDIGVLTLKYTDRDFSDFNVIMKDACLECIDMMNSHNDPQMIDIIMDKALYSQMLEIAEDFNNDYVTSLIKINIDLNNIKTYFRIKKMGKNITFLEKALLNGGKVNKQIFTECLTLSDEEFYESMKLTDYSDVIEKSIGKSALFIEKVCNDYMLSYVESSKYVSMGIEPLIGYLIKKEEEIKNIRIIMVGKINNLSVELIKERIKRDV